MGEYGTRISDGQQNPITKLEAYRQGHYEFRPPPAYHGAWTEEDWIRYIDRDGRWTVEVTD